MRQDILDLLNTYYGITEDDLVETVPYNDIYTAGYGRPADKGVHALHVPEDSGTYYIIKCRENCPICTWSN